MKVDVNNLGKLFASPIEPNKIGANAFDVTSRYVSRRHFDSWLQLEMFD